MEYSKLLDLATDLGYELAINGAETYRVEESINRVLAAYEIESETFVIPNCMHISIEPVIGRPLTRMRRIGLHGNNFDAVERFSNVSRRICTEKPAPEIAIQWLTEAKSKVFHCSFPLYLAGNFLSALGFAILFGGSALDGVLSGICGLVIGLINHWMEKLGANQFFRTLAASFPMALLTYITNALFPIVRSDVVIIGALMLLVPGLLFTNAMRDILFGDTNSGINRIMQVFLIAVAIALGAAGAWNIVSNLWAVPVSPAPIVHSLFVQCIGSTIGCIGFAILFNIHGPGILLCTFGGLLTWVVYAIALKFGLGDIIAYFLGAVFASAYAEIMARIRKYPAISYLVVSIISLIPGSGIYYTMEFAVRGQMEHFSDKCMQTIAIAGIMALGILLVSTIFRMLNTSKISKK